MNNFKNNKSAFSSILSGYNSGVHHIMHPIFGSPFRLLIIVAFSVFFCEVLVMIFLSLLPPLSTWREAFFDSFILMILLSPVFYLFLFRPLIQHIEKRKQAEIEREKVINDLQSSLAEIKTLRGILQICASCKKIRDDQGYWEQIEVYIGERSEADFSHSICPKCAKELYPDLDIYDD